MPLDHDEENPCIPSPCGQFSECHVIYNNLKCSCLPNYIGSPPFCRPECIASTDCPQNQACINMQCKDVCIGSCGYGAICQVVNHNPVCSCPSGQTGNPYEKCIKKPNRKTL